MLQLQIHKSKLMYKGINVHLLISDVKTLPTTEEDQPSPLQHLVMSVVTTNTNKGLMLKRPQSFCAVETSSSLPKIHIRYQKSVNTFQIEHRAQVAVFLIRTAR